MADHALSWAQRAWSSTRQSDFARKVSETYATRVALMGLTLISTVVITRLLGPRGRGLYAVAAATGALGVQFTNLGLHTSNVYYGARDPDSVPLLAGNSLAVSFGFGSLVALVVGGILLLEPNLISLRGFTLLLVLLWIPFGLAYSLLQNLLLGVQDVRGYNLLELANKILPLVATGVLFAIGAVSVASLFGTGVFALVACCAFSLLRLNKHFPVRPRVSWATFRNSIKYALKAYLAGFFCFLVLRADLFMVQHMLGTEQAGYYSIASTMADYVSMMAVVIATILFPRLSSVNDLAAKLRMTRQVARITAAILVPSLVLASLLARPVVQLLFGSAFLPASWAFILLMPGMLFLGIHMVTVQFLNSVGYPRSVVLIWGLCSLLNIVVNIWAIPRYGIAGASMVSSASYFMAFMLILEVIRRTGRNANFSSATAL